jgi:peptidoglycan/xylan/chitin deacetylase (PgdA/CDA1 family)
VAAVAPGEDHFAPGLPRARPQPEGRWQAFVVAVVVTVVLVVAVLVPPLHDLFRERTAQSREASGVLLAGDDVLPAGSRSGPTIVPATSATAVAPVTTVATEPAPTTTTVKLRAPGLGLPPQPTPTPVPLPAVSLAPVFSRIPTPNKVIFLGIDDGLIRDPAVAALLEQANIPFTMFLVQGQAEAGADYFRRLERAGGVVEAHTINHPDLTKSTPSDVVHEVCGPLDDLEGLFGRRPTLFRPPYGTYNYNVRAAVATCGLKAVVLWKASTNDGRFDLQEGTQLTPGDIVLMHFRDDLLANLQRVFTVCKQQGFAIARLEDYLPG